MQLRVKNYFRNVYENGMLDTIEKEENALSNLSAALREDIFYEDKGSVLKKIPLFRTNFSNRLIKRLS